ncbi:glycosyltransferase [Actinomycetospora corticicola]|uniref:Glycosyltransferase involved in cell wall biosynthesis n=1 Tax=Actinomycetospora corticicola TaxID=663602 RepID=A0A7Y9J427_9PSEU|nr:glycosyltransferase involved in cell wall biosynthesis [Actinomycetospora corticicola]
MRVALVHSFHHSDVPSGENVVVNAQEEALLAAGHEVLVVAQDNDVRSRRRTYPLEAAATVVTGFGPDPTEMLRRIAPDVVHVHNLFPNFGTRWLPRWEGPLVATLHNFRPICPAGTLLRDGHRCTDCTTDPRAAVRHRCFQESRVATLPLAVAGRRGAPHHPVIARADRLITISERAAAEYRAVGVGAERLVVVPNAVPDDEPGPVRSAVEHELDPRWLFLGRLSAEKGVGELLARWPAGLRLDVVGSGWLEADLRAAHADRPEIRFLGALSNVEVRTRLAGYTGLVVPSLWAEAGPPLTYVEALAAGVPVVAVEGNGAADDIARNGTGLVVGKEFVEDLAIALKDVARDRPRLGPRARAVYEQHFSTGAWVRALTDVYREAARG